MRREYVREGRPEHLRTWASYTVYGRTVSATPHIIAGARVDPGTNLLFCGLSQTHSRDLFCGLSQTTQQSQKIQLEPGSVEDSDQVFVHKTRVVRFGVGDFELPADYGKTILYTLASISRVYENAPVAFICVQYPVL